jgi:cytochrome c oxidase cbb3-type subunit III
MLLRSACAVLIAWSAAGCDREARYSEDLPRPEAASQAPLTIGLVAGPDRPVIRDPRAGAYEQNSFEVSEGQRLYADFNCVGCHAHGGGDVGPPLMDAEWIYGGASEQIVATIDQGRPNGMPSFRDMLTDRQMWQLAAYVRSLSGQLPKDVPSSRSDTMANTESLILKDEEEIRGAPTLGPEGPR